MTKFADLRGEAASFAKTAKQARQIRSGRDRVRYRRLLSYILVDHCWWSVADVAELFAVGLQTTRDDLRIAQAELRAMGKI